MMDNDDALDHMMRFLPCNLRRGVFKCVQSNVIYRGATLSTTMMTNTALICMMITITTTTSIIIDIIIINNNSIIQ